MDPNKLPVSVLAALVNRGHTVKEITEMTPMKAFSEFCNWEGLVGWGDELWFLVGEIKKAEEE